MITEEQYMDISKKVEELLKVVDNETPKEDRNYIDLEALSKLMADYEDSHNYFTP